MRSYASWLAAGQRRLAIQSPCSPRTTRSISTGSDQLRPAEIEKQILDVAPQVRDCLVASARLRGRVQTDVLLVLRPGVDPDDDHEAAIRPAFTDAEAATIRRVFVIGSDRRPAGRRSST